MNIVSQGLNRIYSRRSDHNLRNRKEESKSGEIGEAPIEVHRCCERQNLGAELGDNSAAERRAFQQSICTPIRSVKNSIFGYSLLVGLRIRLVFVSYLHMFNMPASGASAKFG